MKRIVILYLFLLPAVPVLTQDSTHSGKLSITGYAEIYYQYDLNKPVNGNRPDYIYSHNRHNEFNLNLGFFKAAYKGKYSRANLAAAAGTYINANYSNEPGVLKNIFEANAGIRLSKKKELWLDAGILPSHIGAESAISKDCPVLTRSLVAENSPYFEAGAKLSYLTADGKWIISGLMLNGWQRITRLAGCTKLNAGTQLQYKPNDKLLLNYSTFFGSDKPDSNHQRRTYHNWYGLFTPSDKWSFTFGFDLGSEEKPGNQNGFNYWYAPLGVVRYSFHPEWSLAARAEYFDDRNAVIIPLQNNNGFRVTGFSINLDYAPDNNILLRLEAKNHTGKEELFTRGNQYSRRNTLLAVSLAASF